MARCPSCLLRRSGSRFSVERRASLDADSEAQPFASREGHLLPIETHAVRSSGSDPVERGIHVDGVRQKKDSISNP